MRCANQPISHAISLTSSMLSQMLEMAGPCWWWCLTSTLKEVPRGWADCIFEHAFSISEHFTPKMSPGFKKSGVSSIEQRKIPLGQVQQYFFAFSPTTWKHEGWIGQIHSVRGDLVSIILHEKQDQGHSSWDRCFRQKGKKMFVTMPSWPRLEKTTHGTAWLINSNGWQRTR